MKEFYRDVKSQHGAIAFIELNDDSVWEVGIIPRSRIDILDRQSLAGYHTYSMYQSRRLGIGYIDKFDIINSEIKLIDGVSAILYGIVITEKLLPLGKVELLCYKKTKDGIEEFPSESEEEEENEK